MLKLSLTKLLTWLAKVLHRGIRGSNAPALLGVYLTGLGLIVLLLYFLFGVNITNIVSFPIEMPM